MTRRRQRIVKPRTAKQREHAKHYSARPMSKIAIMPRDTGLPASSWWAAAPRHGFTRIAQLESERMRLSQFGSIRNTTYGDEA